MVNTPKQEPSSPNDVPQSIASYALAQSAHMQHHLHGAQPQSPHRLSPHHHPFPPYSEAKNQPSMARRSFSGESSSQRSSTGPSPSQNAASAIVSKSYANMVNLSLNMQTPTTINQSAQMGHKDYLCMCTPTPKIPRPRNAFILYRQHHQADVAAQNPGLPNPEISKIIGSQWKQESEEVKEQWKALAEEEKLRHQRQYPEYRYQPRRTARPTGRVGMDDPGNICPQCGGRMIPTPRTPRTSFPSMLNPEFLGHQYFRPDPRGDSRDGPRRGHGHSHSIDSHQGFGDVGDSPGPSLSSDEMPSSSKRRRVMQGYVASGEGPISPHPPQPPPYGYPPQEQHAQMRYENSHRGYNAGPAPPPSHGHGYSQAPPSGPPPDHSRGLGPAPSLAPVQHRDYQIYHQRRSSGNEHSYPPGPTPGHSYGHSMSNGGPLPPLEVSGGNHSVPLGPGSTPQQMRRPLPGIRTDPTPPLANPQPRFGDESLRLPPLKSQIPQHVSSRTPSGQECSSNASNPDSVADTVIKSDEKSFLGISNAERLDMISKLAPALQPSTDAGQRYDIRGAIIAVEGFDLKDGVDQVSAVVHESLAVAPSIALKTWSDESSGDDDVTMGDDSASQNNDTAGFEAIKAYHDLVGRWLVKSREMITHITTIPGSRAEQEVDGNDPSVDKNMSTTPPPPPSSSNSNETAKIPVALVTGGYRASIATRYATKVPMPPGTSAMDHYQWMANMWLGVVGPDLVIQVVAGAAREDATAVSMTRPNLITVGVNEKGVLDESNARRLAFEVNEWMRGGSFRHGF
ncbi:hypothetical protein TD95_004658 [Thielaviopsis punctulata]|uniref:HMG box domain-containing protein n=1 Tax=Thielaviopsis punctulata TaxID=72032 RepID=A0A0F4ZGX4_9PEZI|nr:hypothetical protein TD95_004658 [Thielaviopsis punctulata]